MKSGIDIRPARAGDAAAIAKVHVETWRAAYAGLVPNAYLVRMTESGQAFTWRKLLGRPEETHSVLVAEAPISGPRGPKRIVGFGSCGPQRGRSLEYDGEVFTLYVAEDWQGQGIGKLLLGSLFRRLREQGVHSSVLWVLAANPSRFFYEAMGGQRVAERTEDFAGEQLRQTAYAWADLSAWLSQARL